MMSKTITPETNGWGAWRNSQKENEVLKSKLNEYHTKDNVRSLEDKSETELIKNMIIKKKNEIKQLILEAETKKHLLTEKIQKLNDEYMFSYKYSRIKTNIYKYIASPKSENEIHLLFFFLILITIFLQNFRDPFCFLEQKTYK